MATKYYCDRCGAERNKDNLTTLSLDGRSTGYLADLCLDCMKALRQFIFESK